MITPARPGATLVTGFLGFGPFVENPSAALAAGCGRPFELIEVTFAAADAFVESLAERSFDRLVLMGVAASSSTFRLECRAANRVGPGADVRGVVRAGSVIDELAPAELATTLWGPEVLARLAVGEGSLVTSWDAGEYLCNYLYFRALRRVVDRPVGFLHVPPVEVMGMREQGEVVGRVLGVVEAVG